MHSNFKECNYVKETLEQLNHLDVKIIKPKAPYLIPLKGSAEEMFFIEEVKDWFIRRKKQDKNMHKACALILGQRTKRLN